MSRLLITQRHHRVDLRGATRGDITGQQRHADEQRGTPA